MKKQKIWSVNIINGILSETKANDKVNELKEKIKGYADVNIFYSPDAGGYEIFAETKYPFKNMTEFMQYLIYFMVK